MRRRLDIADVEERTKIRAKYLRALENEEFSLLPGATYARTFLRTYAEFLGLDAKRLVEQYRAEYEREPPETEPLVAIAPPSERTRRLPRPASGPRPLAVAGLAAGALLLVLFVLGLTSGGNERPAKRPTGSVGAGPRAAGGQQAEVERKRRPQGAASTVVVEPTVPTYVCMDRGPGTPIAFEGILQRPLRASGPRLRLNLGKTSVRLLVNGRAVDIPPGPNPVGYDIEKGQVRPLEPGQRPCVRRPATSTTTPTTPGAPATGAPSSGL